MSNLPPGEASSFNPEGSQELTLGELGSLIQAAGLKEKLAEQLVRDFPNASPNAKRWLKTRLEKIVVEQSPHAKND